MTIIAASRSRCSFALVSRSARSTLPLLSLATGTTVRPAATALAGLVPWAKTESSRCSGAPGPDAGGRPG